MMKMKFSRLPYKSRWVLRSEDYTHFLSPNGDPILAAHVKVDAFDDSVETTNLGCQIILASRAEVERALELYERKLADLERPKKIQELSISLVDGDYDRLDVYMELDADRKQGCVHFVSHTVTAILPCMTPERLDEIARFFTGCAQDMRRYQEEAG